MENNEKRFAIMPLLYENADRALRGEIILDDESGAIWTRNRKTGELVSATQNILDYVDDALDTRTANISYAFNNNRNVYRFYFTGQMVKLDASLNLPAEYVYFRIRSIDKETNYFVNKLCKVNETATVVDHMILENNKTYFVEFYSINLELLTQILFTAKSAHMLERAADPDFIIDHIRIETNRNVMFVGESLKNINCRVFAVYKSGAIMDISELNNVVAELEEGSSYASKEDVTDNASTLIDLSNININKPGSYTIKAAVFNRLAGEAGEYMYATKTILVTEDQFDRLIDNGLVVIPRIITLQSSAVKEIRLQVVGYFASGEIRDVTDEVVISNYDSSLFDVRQPITVTFNPGRDTVIEIATSFIAYSSSAEVETNNKIVYFNNDLSDGYILNLHDSFIPVKACTYYRVRHSRDLSDNGYYTVKKSNPIDCPALYVDLDYPLTDGDYVIVEFYSVEGSLVVSDVFLAKAADYSNVNTI